MITITAKFLYSAQPSKKLPRNVFKKQFIVIFNSSQRYIDMYFKVIDTENKVGVYR